MLLYCAGSDPAQPFFIQLVTQPVKGFTEAAYQCFIGVLFKTVPFQTVVQISDRFSEMPTTAGKN